MSKIKTTKKQQVINHFIKHPLSTPKVVSEKFSMALPAVYTLRKQATALDKKAENARQLGLDYEPVLKDNSNYRYDPPVAEPVQSCYCPNCETMGKELAALKAQPAVPDALFRHAPEHPQYIEGWNDCRAEMLKGMKP
jgi:hypothetical protein